MGLREIMVDDVWWVVFDVYPGSATGRPLMETREPGGWLCAQSLSDKRRIVPLPLDWEAWPDDHLADAVRSARPLPPMPLP
jgi:hypothetical protein